LVTEIVVNVPEGQTVTIMQGTRTVEMYQLHPDERAIVTIKIVKAVYSPEKEKV
jgi:hypothetical protein